MNFFKKFLYLAIILLAFKIIAMEHPARESRMAIKENYLDIVLEILIQNNDFEAYNLIKELKDKRIKRQTFEQAVKIPDITNLRIPESLKYFLDQIKKGELFEVANMFKSNPFDLNIPGKINPLFWAIYYDKPDITEFLIDNGANFNTIIAGMPLNEWVVRIAKSLDMVKLLANKNMEITYKPQEGEPKSLTDFFMRFRKDIPAYGTRLLISEDLRQITKVIA